MSGRGRTGWTEHRVEAAEAGRTVKEILRGPLGVSGRMVQRLTRSRGLRLNGRPTHLSRAVREGDVVAARLDRPETPALQPVRMRLAVIYEDEHLLVVDKPAGLLVHPVAPSHTRTLAHGVAHHYRERGIASRVRPVHRLDRDTSGLVLFANTAHAQHRLDRQLRSHEMGREYLAWVHGAVAAERGVIDAPIGAHPERADLRAVADEGQPARTHYEVVERFGRRATLLRLRLETGRTHQIRVHLAHLGHPVVGDAAYGGRAAGGIDRPALHAERLQLEHPATGEPLALEAPVPGELMRLSEALGEGAEAG